MQQLNSKIIKFEICSKQPTPEPVFKGLHEKISRPDILFGTTYKIKTPLSEHALYITMNDIELNGRRYPYEIFVNSKNMEHYQWIVALTRIISAVFRKGGDIEFLVEELHSVFDPRGGYYRPGGRYMPSLVAELGDVIDIHLKSLNPVKGATNVVESSKKKYCKKCNSELVKISGCETCTNCGDYKCE